MQLSKNCSIVIEVTVTAGAAGSADIEGTVIDMEGFEGVMFIVMVGAVTSGAVTTIKAQQGTDATVTDAADLLGTSITIADTDDEKVKYLDIYKPLERYVRLYTDRATQNATITAVAIKYGARKLPTTHGTNVAGESHCSPAEGTA